MSSAARKTIKKELKDAEREWQERMDPKKQGKKRTYKTKKTTSNTKKSATNTRAKPSSDSTTKRKSKTTYKRKAPRRKTSTKMELIETIFASEGFPRALRMALEFLILGFIIYGYYKYTMYDDGGLLIGEKLIDFDFISNVVWVLLYTCLVFFLGYKYSERKRKK